MKLQIDDDNCEMIIYMKIGFVKLKFLCRIFKKRVSKRISMGITLDCVNKMLNIIVSLSLKNIHIAINSLKICLSEWKLISVHIVLCSLQ